MPNPIDMGIPSNEPAPGPTNNAMAGDARRTAAQPRRSPIGNDAPSEQDADESDLRDTTRDVERDAAARDDRAARTAQDDADDVDRGEGDDPEGLRRIEPGERGEEELERP